jgi:hypothetical protein
MTTPHDDPLPPALRDIAALVVSARTDDGFAPGFADRVADRIARAPEASLVLPAHVRRVVPLVAAASLVLAATNWWSARDSGVSPIAAAIGLPSVTVADALTITGPDTPGVP